MIRSMKVAFRKIMHYLKRHRIIVTLKNKVHKSPGYGILKKIKEKADDFQDNLSCVRTRLQYYGQRRRRKSYNTPWTKFVKRAVDSMDDCMEFLSEPLYGFRANVTFMQACGSCPVYIYLGISQLFVYILEIMTAV